MTEGNHSTVTEFILAGLTKKPVLQIPLLLFFLGIYVVTVVGNLGVITLIGLSSHLHTPMYYFLSSLSFIDLCHSTVITPKMLVNFVTEKNIISFPECMTQLYFVLVFVISECHMLAAMAYDRYVAIYNLLLYNITMSYEVCFWMIVGVYIMGFIGATAHTGCMLRVLFCKAEVINHYFCDLFPLLELSCSSTYTNEVVVLYFSAFNILAPILAILSSCIFIIASILHIRSTEVRTKAFSTCSFHNLAVSIFFGSAAFMYLQPILSQSHGPRESVFCVLYHYCAHAQPSDLQPEDKDVKVDLKKILESKQFL